jgi:hypothetical protein
MWSASLSKRPKNTCSNTSASVRAKEDVKCENKIRTKRAYIEPDAKVIDAAEAESAFFFETLCASLKISRKVGPVAVGSNVMVDVVAIVERALLRWAIHARVRQSEVVPWSLRIDKHVLAPVAEHKEEGGEYERQSNEPRTGPRHVNHSKVSEVQMHERRKKHPNAEKGATVEKAVPTFPEWWPVMERE